MAFVFVSGFFLLRRNKRGLAVITLIGSIAYGALMGAARINQGAHFFSDVVWSAGVCYLSAALIFYLLGLNRGILVDPPSREGKRRRFPLWVYILTIVLGLGALFGALLNTPYHEELIYKAESTQPNQSEAKYSLRLEPGENSVIQAGDMMSIQTKRDGFGLPGSAIKDTTRETNEDGEHYYQFKQRTSGLFIELVHKTEATLPAPGIKTFVRVNQHGGSLRLAPATTTETCKWKLELGGLKNLQISLPKEAAVRIQWPGELPAALQELFQPVPDSPGTWQTGEGKASIQMEFDFGDASPPEVSL